jgi:phosphoenolpyruvate phosphomutase-like protein/zinc-binding alcohol dehydrogenase family protein
MLAVAARIARSVDAPVTVDAEAGYGMRPADLVAALRDMGAAGCNLEDSGYAADALRDPDEHATRPAATTRHSRTARIASPTGAAGEGPGRTRVIAAPTAENLQRLGTLLADGTLRVTVQRTYPLAQAPEALATLTAEHSQGKLAIQVR